MITIVRLVAWREITSRAQQKSYRVGLSIALLLTVIAVLLPSFFRGGGAAKSYDVAIVGPAGNAGAVVQAVGRAQGVRITLHTTNPEQARAKVKSGTWDGALAPGSTIIARHSGDAVVAILQTAGALSSTIGRLTEAGLTPKQAAGALDSTPLRVESTASETNSQRQTIAIVTVVVLFSQLIQFCTWVAMGVVEEKSSRVVELLLSSVRPVQLLAGKLLGIGALAAAQVAALGAAALITATASKTVTLPASELLTVLISFVAFLLGFAFFASLSAALASTVSRQEDVSGIMAPVTVSLTLSYLAAFTVAAGGDSTFARVLSLVPPVSSIAMPARIARGEASVADVVLAIGVLIVTAAAILTVAARIYRASILHTGSRLKLRRAWRGEAVAAQP